MPKGYFLWNGVTVWKTRSGVSRKWLCPSVLIDFPFHVFPFQFLLWAFLISSVIPFALIGAFYDFWFGGEPFRSSSSRIYCPIRTCGGNRIVMVIYLNDAMVQLIAKMATQGRPSPMKNSREYVIHGAAKRLRPKITTVFVTLSGLFPSCGATAGSDSDETNRNADGCGVFTLPFTSFGNTTIFICRRNGNWTTREKLTSLTLPINP